MDTSISSDSTVALFSSKKGNQKNGCKHNKMLTSKGDKMFVNNIRQENITNKKNNHVMVEERRISVVLKVVFNINLERETKKFMLILQIN